MSNTIDQYIQEGLISYNKGSECLDEFISFIPPYIEAQFNFMLKDTNHKLSFSFDSFAVKFKDYIEELIHRG